MKIVTVYKGNSRRRREIEVPETWEEGRQMLLDVMDPHFDKRGGNLERLSAVARVAYGLFANKGGAVHPADPTIVLVYLMQKICKREGAGL